MNQNRKRILLVISGLLATCLILGAAGWLATRAALDHLSDFASDDPGLVAQVGRSIAFFELPPGFGHGQAIHQPDYALVTYEGADGRSHITLFQVSTESAAQAGDLQDYLRQLTAVDDPAAALEHHSVDVRGRRADLIISDGANDHGPYRTATLLFDGLGGPALASITMPQPAWDQELVDTFIGSVR